MTFTKT